MLEQLMEPLRKAMWKATGQFQDFIRAEIAHALELDHDSQTFEYLFRLTELLRAGGHIEES